MKLHNASGKLLAYDDVVILPGYSEIASRMDIDISTSLAGVSLEIPIVGANMDSVTGEKMCEVLDQRGGIGILHRFAPDDVLVSWIDSLTKKGVRFGASVGVKRDDDHLVKVILGKGVTMICIDVAHGHHLKVKQRIRYIKSFNSDAIVIAGNVCTNDGAEFLAEAGADIIKVGIGSGSLCTTRLVTGCGSPQLSAVMEAAKVKKRYPNVSIIADGGIRNPGDVVKALAAGADAVMIGNLLAGTDESPGDKIVFGPFTKPKIYKQYRGSASMSCKADSGSPLDFVEGTSTLIPYRGTVETVTKPIEHGLRSGMSYVGAADIKSLKAKAVMAEITQNGIYEGTPHGASELDS